MFKFIVAIVLLTVVSLESFKHSTYKNLVKTTTSQKHFYFLDTHFMYVFLFLTLFSKLLLSSSSSVLFTFLYMSLLVFNRYTSEAYKQYCCLLPILMVMVWSSINTYNLASFIIVAELLSITMFFVLFFSVGFFSTSLNLGVFYFLIGNIVTFLFGVLFIFITLCCYGTLNIQNVSFFIESCNDLYVLWVFAVYIVLKLGQGPAVFFKFRFYRATNLFNLIYYVFTYIILIWPFLLYVVIEFNLVAIVPITTLILSTITFFLLQSVFFFTSVVDFIVFSTWAFIWYQSVYVMI